MSIHDTHANMAALINQYHPPHITTTTHTSSYPFISPSKYRGKLDGKIVLITGAGRGIGRLTALAFAAAGASIACVSRTSTELDSLVEEITQNHGKDAAKPRALGIPGDVTDQSFAPKAIKEIEEKLGPIDILINNAGISRLSDLEHEKDVSAAWKVVEVSMLGTMSFTQAAIPSMIARKTGTILNVVSKLGHIVLPFFSAYCAAKGGIIKYTETIDLELRPKGIYTYAVHPCVSKDTTLGRGAVNEDAKATGMGEFLAEFFESCTDSIDLAADTMVALCVEEGARLLSGTFFDATYDLGEQIQLAKVGKDLDGKEKKGRLNA